MNIVQTHGDATVLLGALTRYAADLEAEGLGDDEHGKWMTQDILSRIARMLQRLGYGGGHHESNLLLDRGNSAQHTATEVAAGAGSNSSLRIEAHAMKSPDTAANDAKDAARYRWLRARILSQSLHADGTSSGYYLPGREMGRLRGVSLDEAIDTAIAAPLPQPPAPEGE